MEQQICVDGKIGCSACGACLTMCPKQAIFMCEDRCGFLYPSIDHNLCVECGRCVQTCNDCHKVIALKPLMAYAAAGRNAELVKNSASGGIFASIAKKILDDGGKVAGAILNIGNGDVEVRHLLSDSIQDLHLMQGSKYVQSDAWKCYKDVIEALRKGETVLFSGTPCQVAAVKSITGNPGNLLTIDVICHGVPSAAMFREYLKILNKRIVGTVEGFQFRNKDCNRDFCARIDVKRAKRKCAYYIKSSYISFYKYFLKSVTYRENCYNCPYACGNRVSDLTIGDYWGVEKKHADEISSGKCNNHKHWSCLLVNSEKGKHIVDQCSDYIDLIPSRLEWVADENRQLNSPSIRPMKRTQVLEAFEKCGYTEVEHRFQQESGGTLRLLWRTYRDIKKKKLDRKK